MLVKIFDRVYDLDKREAELVVARFQLLINSLDQVFVIDDGGSVVIDLTSTHFELDMISFSDYLMKLPSGYTDADARQRLLELAYLIEPPTLSRKAWCYERYILKPHVQDEAREYLERTIAELRYLFDLSLPINNRLYRYRI